jgi:tetratricopeptide (TPR) repeat protein
MTVRAVLLITALATTLAAQSKKSPDLCAPPPGRVAPSLPAKLLPGQGDKYLHFPITTTSEEAQRFFDQGVAQMHSFWALEAERSFLQAAALDPAAPMPHWGIAMVAAGDYRPRFQLDHYFGKPERSPRADAAAKKGLELSAVPGKATDLEKMYIAAIAARRDPEAKDPDEGYIRGLRAIVEKYPREVEAKSYLALHLMRGYELPSRTPRSTTMEAVALLRELLKEAPDHPGVHHYVIHGWEGSTFAKDAWPSCRRYCELVPNIPHALHMPGHIWSQTGKWEEAEKSFGDAAANELTWMKADALYSTGHHGHNVHYLATAYSFAGNYDKAIEWAHHLLEFKENPREAGAVDSNRTAYRQGWFALMRTLVQHEKWDLILDGTTLPAYEKPREMAWRAWAMGVAHSAKGEADAAKADAKAMDFALDAYKLKARDKVPEELSVAREELDGHIAAAAGKGADAIKRLEHAAKKERALIYSEPPFYPRPVNEALGKLALRQGQLDVAEKAFREALEQIESDTHAVAGLQETLRRANKAATGF